MSRRNKRRHSVPIEAHTTPSAPAVLNGADSHASLLSREVFKPGFEKALAIAKSELQATGSAGTTALFIYGKDPDDRLKENSTHVSLSYKDEFHKEAMRRKIQEKVAAEGASAVVLLVPALPGHKRIFLISGAMPGVAADASVTYTFDKATKTFSFSEMAWRDKPVKNFFLEGLFNAKDG